MRNLTIGDLDLGLRDLFDKRKTSLDLSVAGKIYGPLLAVKRGEIDALPEALRGGRSMAEALGSADRRYDGFGGGIWSYTEAVLTAPDMSEVTRARAQRLRAAFVPKRSDLTDSYAEEARAAKKRRPKLAELEADLKAMPLPEGKTLYDWAMGFLDSGDTLDSLLSARSSAEAAGAGDVAPSKLRASTIKLLGRFRDAVEDEVEQNPALPRDLVALLFSYFDELNARRQQSSQKKKDAPEEEASRTECTKAEGAKAEGAKAEGAKAEGAKAE